MQDFKNMSKKELIVEANKKVKEYAPLRNDGGEPCIIDRDTLNRFMRDLQSGKWTEKEVAQIFSEGHCNNVLDIESLINNSRSDDDDNNLVEYLESTVLAMFDELSKHDLSRVKISELNPNIVKNKTMWIVIKNQGSQEYRKYLKENRPNKKFKKILRFFLSEIEVMEYLGDIA